MARPRTIDRDRLLDAAEQVVLKQGASGLTIDAVARAAGVTKGGVQYSFGSKEVLIAAMFERWNLTFNAVAAEIAGRNPDPARALWAHVEATRRSDYPANAKAASVMAALMQTPEHLDAVRTWYRDRWRAFDLGEGDGHVARRVFLATEGAFMLRFFGLMDMSLAEWEAIFGDLSAVSCPAAEPEA